MAKTSAAAEPRFSSFGGQAGAEALKGPGVTPVAVNLADEGKLAAALKGADVVILAVKFSENDVKPVFAATRNAGLNRIIIVGGAASLFNQDNVRLLDTPPDGRDRWTLDLLAERMVKLNYAPALSGDTVGRTLKKTTSSRG